MAKIKDTTDKLVYGHEGWLEDDLFHYHAGDTILTKFNWGHDMKRDGLPRLYELDIKAFGPKGDVYPVEAEETGEEYVNLTTDTDREGMYIFTGVYDNCYAEYPDNVWKKGTRENNPDAINVGRYVQSYTNCISVGHSGDTNVFDAPLPTSLLPVNPKYVVGNELTFVLKTEGKPQSTDDVIIIYDGKEGQEKEKVTIGEDGILKFTPKKAGVYDIIARYTLPANESDPFEDIIYTATHCFRVKEHDVEH